MNSIRVDVGSVNNKGGEIHTDKEKEILGSENQFVVHGAYGPFLMDKDKWPKMLLATEYHSQE